MSRAGYVDFTPDRNPKLPIGCVEPLSKRAVPTPQSPQHMSAAVSYKTFPAPVRLLSQGSSRVVATVFEAVEFLGQWPAVRSKEYRLAMHYCLDALDGIRSPKHAYLAFVDAVSVAGLAAAD